MYKLTIRSHFDAAHFLANYEGGCEELHGHTYRVEVVAQGEELDKAGIVCDFKHLKKAVSEVMSQVDHKNLNEVSPFKETSSTTENLAKHFFYQLKQVLPKKVDLKEVTVWESDNTSATYLE